MHFDAMVRLQVREDLVLQARREAEELSSTQVNRTAGTVPVSSSAQRERLYMSAVEQQAKQERRVLERQRELHVAELDGTTFSPVLTRRGMHLRTDGVPVEVRMRHWEEVRQTKLADKVAASPTAQVSAIAAHLQSARRRARTGNPTIAANYANTPTRTVDTF
jgi:hypothetical protein